jgi:probable HAF family extracellular repeat protein
MRIARALGAVAVIVVLAAPLTWGQAASFTGTGRLAAGKLVKAFGVSANGTVVVGDAIDADGKTQAFVWTVAGGLHGIGYLNPTNKETHATDVGLTSTGQIRICGYGKDAAGKNRAFLWSGDAFGTGTFELIPLLAGGTQNQAYGLYVTSADTVLVAGDSESSSAGTGKQQGFYWQTGEPDCDGLGFLNGGTPDSHGRAIAIRDGVTNIVGYSNSRWSGGYNSREAAKWEPSTLSGEFGLTKVCDGEGWQILAGPNGIAETVAHPADLQITPVGTMGLDPETVVVSAGPDSILKDQSHAAGDDVLAPISPGTPSANESIYRAVSPNGRYRVGRSNYVIGNNSLWEAFLRDVKNRDYSAPDNCGGFVFDWPLGFVKQDNTGAPIADNYSDAFAVSNGASPTGSRNGLVVVGSSLNLADPTPRPTRAFICMIQDGPDLWFLRQQGADPSDYGARVAGRFKDMRNLQVLLSHDFGLDLAGWDLREADAVSDNGTIVVGWGLHDGVEEGFVATIPGLPSKGACCHRPSLTCTIGFPGDCTGEFLGPESVCTRCCPKPFSDQDQDGDVDAVDFARFQACMTTGQAVPTISAACACFDQDNNGAIDEDDFVHGFVTCGTGPGLPVDPNCQ